MRIDTQKQTLSARDESIKKLLEMLQTKGEGKEEEARVHQQMQMVAQKQVNTQTNFDRIQFILLSKNGNFLIIKVL